MSYSVTRDTRSGIVICRLHPDFVVDAIDALCDDLDSAISAARSHGPVRLLWENRIGHNFPAAAQDRLRDVTARGGHAADRIAILVRNSVEKARSRAYADDGTEIFASENAAMLWLSVDNRAAA